ncbi:hypothetical protein E2562_036849 [Oryza meyeriana var. granulata]|uniref:Uncharacterized protein n=1 Tax=Oryza meyeriana var. granulata TaxID=110450 RepID=A0A6G1E868_9ORYZ|nr:hypothetical protein E2562_036849 [Oryza meyeriana var. granulata]
MHEWREIALKVPGTLMLIGTAGMEALRLIEVAARKFQERVGLLRELRQGTLVDVAVDNFADPDPEEVLPTEILEDAHREISQTAARHAKTHHVFVRYAAYLGIGIQDDPVCRSWDSHYQDAMGHTDKALKRVINAVSNAEAGKDAVAMIEILPYRCPLWEGWALEAQNLTTLATLNAALAMEDVRRARHDVALEFFDAWIILRRSGVLRLLDDSASRS